MGILASARKAIRNHIDKLEADAQARRAMRAQPEQSEQSRPTGTDFDGIGRVVDELEKYKLEFEKVGRLNEELAFYKRRSQEYFSLIQRIEAQREEWKALYRRDSAGHQQAQSIMQEHIVQARQLVASMFRTVNEYRKKNGEEPLPNLSIFLVDAYPVGIAEETKKRNEQDLASVSPQINATEATEVIDREVPAPDGAVDVSHGAV